MIPQRIQRSRTKGWRMPAGAVYVGRPTLWGNPFRVVRGRRSKAVTLHRAWLKWGRIPKGTPAFAAINLQALRRMVLNSLGELRGKDLACWCRLDERCHADTLLELANETKGG